MLPNTIKNFNLFIDGASYLGRAEQVTLPKLTRKTDEFRGGGMNAPVEIDMGSEKLEASFVLREFNNDVLLNYGIVDSAGVSLRFKAAAQRDDVSGDTDAIEVVIRGRWRELDFGDLKSGENASLTVAVAASYFKYIVNDVVLIEVDSINMIEKAGDNDRLAGQRKALGI